MLATDQWLLACKQTCSNSMTKNNLREHLTWLIESQPTGPPPPPRPPQPLSDHPPQPATFFGSATGVDKLTHIGRFEIAGPEGYPESNSHAGKEASHPEFARPLLPASVLNAEGGDAMARLQSGSSSRKKPVLLSLNERERIPLALQTPTPLSAQNPGTSLKDSYSAQYGQKGSGKS